MYFGTHGLLGAMIGVPVGAGINAAVNAFGSGESEEYSNAEIGAALGTGMLAGTMAKPAIAWAGRNMANFSEGYYNLEPFDDMTRFESKVLGGNQKMVSIKRNLGSAIRGKQQLRNNVDLTLLDNKELKKIQNKTQFEKLQVELNANDVRNPRTGKPIDAVTQYHRYKNNNFPNSPNTTAEEALWHFKQERAKKINFNLDKTTASLERQIASWSQGGNNYERMLKHMNPQTPDEIRAFNRRMMLNKAKASVLYSNAMREFEKAGEYGRKWRHEIAKNEVHAMWANKPWSKRRLAQAGYAWEGAYRWGDLKKFFDTPGLNQWERSVNDVGKKVASALKVPGLAPTLMNDNTVINFMRNTNVHDNVIKRQPSRVFQGIGRDIAHLAGNHNYKLSEVRSHIRNNLKYNPHKYNFTTRDLKEWSEKTNDEVFKRQYKEWKGMKKSQKLSDKGLKLYNRLSYKYGKAVADDMLKQAQKQGAFTKAFGAGRGNFTIQGMGRVTKSYLEGGINMTTEFRAFAEPRSAVPKVAMRTVTSDLSDLLYSVESGVQRNVPLIAEEHYQTYNGKTGKLLSGRPAMTNSNPFKGRYEAGLDDLKQNRLIRGDVKRTLLKDGYNKMLSLKNLRFLQRAVTENPTRFLKYAANRSLGIVSNPVVASGLIAWSVFGGMKGEQELSDTFQ
tara:strand:- start:682 stop:2700 length:2019 start_codon:yes stop_codon:yes gene_type:complete